MKHLLGAFAALLLMASTTSHASFLIEPYLGYHMGKMDSGSKEDAKGTTYGGRLGFSKLGLQFGADYMAGNWEVDNTPANFKGKANNLGVFVGYDFPILLRVYGSYFFDAELKDRFKLEGNMIRLGVGLSPLPLVDVNLEYMTGTYDKADGHSLSSDYKLNMFGVTVSIPFTL